MDSNTYTYICTLIIIDTSNNSPLPIQVQCPMHPCSLHAYYIIMASFTQATLVRGHCMDCCKIIKTSSLQRSGNTSSSWLLYCLPECPPGPTYLKVTICLRVLMFDISEDWPKTQNFVPTVISYMHYTSIKH